MNYKDIKTNIRYPVELIDNRMHFPQNQAIPCSLLVNNEEIGGVFLVCRPQEIAYFKIRSTPPPEPTLKFRMLDYQKRIFAVEIWMLFNQNPEKYLKMHLNPHDKNVQRLLKLGSETSIIAFHFYDTGTEFLSSTIISLDDEETDWFDRNYKLSAQLNSDHRGYERIAVCLYHEGSRTDRIFKYYNRTQSDFFVRKGGKKVMSHKISK